jgi:hypothetical protein
MFASAVVASSFNWSFPTRNTEAFSLEARLVLDQYTSIFDRGTVAVTTESSNQKFLRLTSAWKTDTRFSSSAMDLLMNPSYLEIISMGEKALPLIFSELQKKADHWFIALSIITKNNPVPSTERGNVKAMTNSWLLWGEKNGYVVTRT